MTGVKIGKTVIETLTSGMYEDARFVYREYLQNAADQIDIAVEQEILPSVDDGKIHITINPKEKVVTIEDNATGVKSTEFYSMLANIASSTKDRNKSKGFRGIGRLGGLGYCSTLVFETSYPGEPQKSIMIWDASKLHQMLNDPKIDIDAAALVSSVIASKVEECEADLHFFKIEMQDVSNTDLLCRKKIEEYLSMVAPVPFAPHFFFKEKIYSQMNEVGIKLDEYCIYLNTDQLFKGYSSKFYEGFPPNLKSYDEIFDIETFDIKNNEGKVIAWCWYGISKFEKQIPNRVNIARGLRLRKSNIQIGSEYTLVKLHKEQRGNFYFVGEVHALHNELIPNSRRDYFNENDTSKFLERKLKEIFHNKFYKLYHDANKIKNAVKKIDSYVKVRSDYKEKINNGGFSSKQQENQILESLEKTKIEAENKRKELTRIKEKSDEDSTLQMVFNKIVTDNEILNNEVNEPEEEKVINKEKYRTQKLTKLSRKEEKIVRKVFEIIDLMFPDFEERAEELKLKIEEEFK